MSISIRDVTGDDLATVLAMNEAAVPHVNSVSIDQMHDFAEHAAYFRVALVDHDVAGYLVGMLPDMAYASPNFRWFCRNYEQFAYVDRIAISEKARRLGLATALYDDFEHSFAGDVPILACEVNLRPPNEASMAFHRRRGFRQVGSQETEGGRKQVAMLVRELTT